MTRATCRVLAMAFLLAPLLAQAEGKCDDDPFAWQYAPGKQMLVVTWTIPYPAGGEVQDDVPDADVQLMADLDARLGAVPPLFPAEHGNPFEYPYPPHPDFPNSKRPLTSVDAVRKYLDDFKMRLEPEAEPYFAEYLDKKRKNTLVHAKVVQHPSDPVLVPDNGRGFRFCTCTLQRAVAVWDAGKEQLWVKSRFRSARDPQKFVNFAPARPVKFTFRRSTIWFPLAFNKIIPEPGVSAFLLLDVLTKQKLDPSSIPLGFTYVQPGPTLPYGTDNWYVTRIWRKYQRSDQADDLELKPVFVAR